MLLLLRRLLPPRPPVVRNMAGHSHWHNIRHKKARVDQARSKLFGRLSVAVTAAARHERRTLPGSGAGEFVGALLARAIDKARRHGLPRARIESAIAAARAGAEAGRCGGGGLGGGSGGDAGLLAAWPDSCVYGGEFTGGVGLLVRIAAGDGGGIKHGVAQDIRGVFDRAGGGVGNVGWLFTEKFSVHVQMRGEGDGEGAGMDELVERGIEHGADDFVVGDDGVISFVLEDHVRGALALARSVESDVKLATLLWSWQPRHDRIQVTDDVREQLEDVVARLQRRPDFLALVHNADIPVAC